MPNVPYKVNAGEQVILTRRKTSTAGGVAEPGVILSIYTIQVSGGGYVYSAAYGSGTILMLENEFERYAPNDFFMVKGSGASTIHHPTFEAADAEAKRLAELHPAQRFYILKTLGFRQVMSPEATFVPMGG